MAVALASKTEQVVSQVVNELKAKDINVGGADGIRTLIAAILKALDQNPPIAPPGTGGGPCKWP